MQEETGPDRKLSHIPPDLRQFFRQEESEEEEEQGQQLNPTESLRLESSYPEIASLLSQFRLRITIVHYSSDNRVQKLILFLRVNKTPEVAFTMIEHPAKTKDELTDEEEKEEEDEENEGVTNITEATEDPRKRRSSRVFELAQLFELLKADAQPERGAPEGYEEANKGYLEEIVVAPTYESKNIATFEQLEEEEGVDGFGDKNDDHPVAEDYEEDDHFLTCSATSSETEDLVGDLGSSSSSVADTAEFHYLQHPAYSPVSRLRRQFELESNA